MVKYGYISNGQTFTKDANVNATPDTWTISAYGIQYGGVEIVDPTPEQETEVTNKSGQLFDSAGYLAWFDAGQPIQEYVTIEL